MDPQSALLALASDEGRRQHAPPWAQARLLARGRNGLGRRGIDAERGQDRDDRARRDVDMPTGLIPVLRRDAQCLCQGRQVLAHHAAMLVRGRHERETNRLHGSRGADA